MGLVRNYRSFSRSDLSCSVRSACKQCWDMWRGPKRNFTRRAAALNLGSQEKSKLRCRTEEMMMRLPVERATARTVYEEVRFVHANRVESICGKFPNIQFSWLQP